MPSPHPLTFISVQLPFCDDPTRNDALSTQLESTTPMERRLRRAAQCAFEIQDKLHDCELSQEVRLSVKIGIGMGKVSVLHLGGVHKRMEYIAVGEPLLEAFTAEHHATPGDVRASLCVVGDVRVVITFWWCWLG